MFLGPFLGLLLGLSIISLMEKTFRVNFKNRPCGLTGLTDLVPRKNFSRILSPWFVTRNVFGPSVRPG